MNKTVAINGSPRMEKGDTAMVLAPFIEGMIDAGSDVELFYASRLKVKPCTCGEMYCWYKRPGECCFKDAAQGAAEGAPFIPSYERRKHLSSPPPFMFPYQVRCRTSSIGCAH